MLEVMRAHGLDAGPTQRPVLAGALAGLLADLPTLALLLAFGTLERMAAAAGLGLPATALLHLAAVPAAGAMYGLVFRRGANDPAGGWLFGTAYGYLVWQAAGVPLLQWLPGEPLFVGTPAVGFLLGHLLWGLLLGLGFRWVHRPFESDLSTTRTEPSQRTDWH